MAEELFILGAAFGTSSNPGTGAPDPTIAALSGNLTSDDGIVLGDAGSGAGDSGLDLQLDRRFRENAVVAGSFTRSPSTYLGTDVATFTFSWQIKGNGLARGAAPADAEFEPVPGVDAILAACGLSGAAWGGGTGWVYTPAAAANAPLTSKIWGTWGSILIYDVVGSLEIAFTPGDVAIATATFEGATTPADRDGSAVFPNFDYSAGTSGDQTAGSPVIESVGHNWGIAGALRGFSEASLSVNNNVETFPDSNAPGGTRARATGREISMDLTLLGDDGESDYELTNLESAAPSDLLTFTVGGPGSTGDPQTGYVINGTTPQNMEWTPDRIGVSSASSNTLWMVSNSANGEFELVFV